MSLGEGKQTFVSLYEEILNSCDGESSFQIIKGHEVSILDVVVDVVGVSGVDEGVYIVESNTDISEDGKQIVNIGLVGAGPT